MASNGSKPYQSRLIAAHGFDVPRTLLTTDPAAVAAFRAEHGSVVYKSMSGVRSIVSRFADSHEARLADVKNCPTQFQEFVEGTDLRVHVVGDDLFACEIVCDADDYRYAARAGSRLALRAISLPADVGGRCLRLAAALGLALAGIDLRRRPDGRWCCFEVNPSPAFTFFADATDQPIGAAVAAMLMGHQVV
jgi:glutathione synthase/RimK-type ligase-like ATP-grasp enzyme